MTSKARTTKSQTQPQVQATTNVLAKYLRSKRIEAGFDVANLAEYSGVSAEAVLLLESNPERASLQDLYAVANEMNLDPGVVLELLHSMTPGRK